MKNENPLRMDGILIFLRFYCVYLDHPQRKAWSLPTPCNGSRFDFWWCSSTRHKPSIIILAHTWGILVQPLPHCYTCSVPVCYLVISGFPSSLPVALSLSYNSTFLSSLWLQGLPEALMKAGAVYKYDLSLPIEYMYNLVEEMRVRLGKQIFYICLTSKTRCIVFSVCVECGLKEYSLTWRIPFKEEYWFSVLVKME